MISCRRLAWTSTFLAACIAALLLTACGSDGTAGTQPLPSQPPAQPNPQPTPQPPPPPPPPTPQPQPEPNPPAQATPKPTAVGTTLGAPVTATIGVAGGEIVSADGVLTVQVPAGAFAADETVSIQVISNEAHGAKGPAFRILPEGIHALKPMTIRFRYSASDLRGTAADLLRIAYQNEGIWYAYLHPAIDTNTRTLSVQTTHFSDWALITGAQLVPHTATMRPGETLELQVVWCEQLMQGDPHDEDLQVPLPVVDCNTAPGARDWAVNGTPGGSAQFGTIASLDRVTSRAIYSTPATKPRQNTVAVSAVHVPPVGRHDGTELTQIVANIVILDEKPVCASLRDATALKARLWFDDFTFTATRPFSVHTGHHSGNLTGTARRLNVGPTGFQLWATYLEPLEEGHVLINDKMVYTPPEGGGHTDTAFGQADAYESGNGGSFIFIKTYTDTCTFDIFGSFFVEGTATHDGFARQQPIGVAGVYVFGEVIPPDQIATTGSFTGDTGLNLTDRTDRNGYFPLDMTGPGRDFIGSTHARWEISIVQ